MADVRPTVLITGAGVGGIGGALAKEIHYQGYRVFAGVRRLSTVRSLEALGIEPVILDVTDAESVQRASTEVSLKTGGKLNVLINNAGLGKHMPATDLEFDVVKAIFEVNVYGVMRMVKAFAPLLIAAEGTVANIGSIAPVLPLMWSSAYNASKAALHAYGDTIRLELKPFNVHVMTIVTGGVRSNIVTNSEHNPSKLPENSIYQRVSEYFDKRVSYSQSSGPMETEAYAKSVVKAIIRRNRPLFWEGYMSTAAWVLWAFVPKGWLDWVVGKPFGIVALRERLQEEKKGEGKKEL